jgi:hypothetical protein
MARPLILVLGIVLILARRFVCYARTRLAAGPQTREFDLRISEGVMESSDIAVAEDDRVVLRILTDSPLEVHVHGYDLERELEPDEPVRLSFEADLTERFEIEAHETEEKLGTLVVEPRRGGLTRPTPRSASRTGSFTSSGIAPPTRVPCSISSRENALLRAPPSSRTTAPGRAS